MKQSHFVIAALLVFSVALLQCKSTQKQPTVAGISGKSNGTNAKGFSQIIQLTDALKASLKEDQLAQLQLPYSKQDAAKWSNFPASFRNAQRVGLNFGAMTPAQIENAKALLKIVAGNTSNEGYDELLQLLNADDYLNEKGGGRDYGAPNYYIAFLGIPSAIGTFEIQFGGHHLAFANTYKNGVLAGATPSFRGVEPFDTFTINGRSNQPMNQEQATLSAMLTSLSTAELAAAKLSGTFSDLLLGPHRDGAFPNTASGIQCSKLTSAQKALVLDGIKTYVADIDNADAKAIMSKYTNELNNTFISYSGTTALTNQNDYVRIDGPSVWIEYSCQHGIVMRGTHPHSVWRDKTNDYGGN